MRQVHYATTNKGKVASLNRALQPYSIEVIQVDMELPELQTTDLRVITTEKAFAAYRIVGGPVIVQDTGFFMQNWNDFPGPFVKFALQTMGLDGFLALNHYVPGGCEFRECLAYYDPELGTPKFFEAIIPGQLSHQIQGVLPPDAWSELVLIFIPNGFTRTIAEMSDDEIKKWRKVKQKNSAEKFANWIAAQ